MTSLRDLVKQEAEEAGRRRGIARSFGTVSDGWMLELARPAPAPAPTPIAEDDPRPFAFSREPCRRCQTRGDLGCAHQRPFQDLSK